jgi:hypothetical protein
MKRRRGSLILIAWSILVGVLMLSRTAMDVGSLTGAGYNGPVGVGIGRQLIGLVCVVPLYITSVIAFLVSGTKAALAIDLLLTAAHFAVAAVLLANVRWARFYDCCFDLGTAFGFPRILCAFVGFGSFLFSLVQSRGSGFGNFGDCVLYLGLELCRARDSRVRRCTVRGQFRRASHKHIIELAFRHSSRNVP